MTFDRSILERTPRVLDAALRGLPSQWVHAVTEGVGTWSPYMVVGHLIHCERTDWMVRVETILQHGPTVTFAPLDREVRPDGTLDELLDEFARLRESNLARLNVGPEDLEKEGTHPAFGRVTLDQLLATWTAHDLAHLVQINRVMARRYREQVGPWAEYLSVMQF
ncbi:MAG: DinB family protein [Acidobacteria bacterium]|nr:DinB family protein [Acidobacteriota bacterium]